MQSALHFFQTGSFQIQQTLLVFKSLILLAQRANGSESDRQWWSGTLASEGLSSSCSSSLVVPWPVVAVVIV